MLLFYFLFYSQRFLTWSLMYLLLFYLCFLGWCVVLFLLQIWFDVRKPTLKHFCYYKNDPGEWTTDTETDARTHTHTHQSPVQIVLGKSQIQTQTHRHLPDVRLLKDPQYSLDTVCSQTLLETAQSCGGWVGGGVIITHFLIFTRVMICL